jgi:hypothetical protein
MPMQPEFKDLETALDRRAPALSKDERARVWRNVEGRIGDRGAIVSPYSFGFINLTKKTMIPLAIALVVLVGASGTVAASDSARPGDLLFPIDRAAEEARIAFAANAEAKAELRARFAEERVKEFEEIVEEESVRTGASASTTVSADGKVRVEHALSVLEGFVADAHVRASSTANARASLERIDARMNAVIDGLPSEIRIRIRDEVNGNADTRARDTRARLDVDQGEIRVDDNRGTSSLEIEADVFTDLTTVMIEMNGRTDSFTTKARTRAEIVAEIARRYSLTEADANAALNLEVEDRASRSGDLEGSVDVNAGSGVNIGGSINIR